VLIEAEQELVKAYMVKEFMKYKDERKLFILPFYIHKSVGFSLKLCFWLFFSSLFTTVYWRFSY